MPMKANKRRYEKFILLDLWHKTNMEKQAEAVRWAMIQISGLKRQEDNVESGENIKKALPFL
jgi:hypothetical protein